MNRAGLLVDELRFRQEQSPHDVIAFPGRQRGIEIPVGQREVHHGRRLAQRLPHDPPPARVSAVRREAVDVVREPEQYLAAVIRGRIVVRYPAEDAGQSRGAVDAFVRRIHPRLVAPLVRVLPAALRAHVLLRLRRIVAQLRGVLLTVVIVRPAGHPERRLGELAPRGSDGFTNPPDHGARPLLPSSLASDRLPVYSARSGIRSRHGPEPHAEHSFQG